MSNEEEAIAAVLARYQETLNRSDIEAAMKLYAFDAVFMPQNSPSSIGIEAIRAAYDAIFRTITLQVTFEVAEIRGIAADWAFARTNSAGKVSVHATGETAAEANQELFLFQKVDGNWKIARYCFSTTNPPHA